MTLSRVGDGTAGYTPASSGANIDAYGLAKPAAYAPAQGVEGGARFQIYDVQPFPDGGERRFWRLELYDMRLGFRQRGRFERDHGAVASSTMSNYFEEQAILPFLTTSDNAVSISTPLQQHSANAFGTLTAAIDNGTTTSFFFKETSATNPAFTRITFAPGSRIFSLTRIVMNSIEYLAAGLASGGAKVLSDLVTAGPTVAGTMDASTAGCTGMIQTFLPGNPILIQANTQLLSLPGNVAIATAPTVKLTNFPSSGYPLGLASLGGGPVRAWWLTNVSASGQFISGSFNGANFRGQIVSTSQDGDTPQVLVLPINAVQHATLYRDGVVATDEDRVVFHNGRFIRDLHIFRDVSPTSDKLYKCVGFYANGPSLFAEINIIASPSGTGNTQRVQWYYDYDLDAWFQVGAAQTLSTTGVLSVPGPLGVSSTTGFLHVRADNKFWRQYQAPFGVAPYNYRKTSGASSGTGQEYEASGVIVPTLNELPGLEGLPKVIRSVMFMGDVDAGGTGGTPAKVNVTAPGIDTSAHSQGDFQTGVSVGGLQRRDFEDNVTSFYKFQPTITATRQSGGTDPTRFTPQVLPIAFEGYADYRPWMAPPSREEVNT